MDTGLHEQTFKVNTLNILVNTTRANNHTELSKGTFTSIYFIDL